ncbi:MAG: cytochrome-c oxidase, cbb3-type subunit III [Hyphomicrobiaceae bacterium]
MSGKKEIDEVTGVETTGHEWDGLKELNKPLPQWWLWTFYACIIWGIGYMIAYPAFPTLASYTKGMLGYSQRQTVADEVKAAKQAQSGQRDLLSKTALGDVKKNAELLRFAMAGGGAQFATSCAPCHGRGAQGATGYPNLNDDEWIWGGSIQEIAETIEGGIRSGHKKARESQMPKFGLDKLLDDKQINDAAEFVLSLSGKATDQAAAGRGKALFADQCASCHGNDGKGMKEQGAPSLADNIWLYGSAKADVVESIRTGRGGIMPSWGDKLDAITVKSLAVYVHSLGGGK